MEEHRYFNSLKYRDIVAVRTLEDGQTKTTAPPTNDFFVHAFILADVTTRSTMVAASDFRNVAESAPFFRRKPNRDALLL